MTTRLVFRAWYGSADAPVEIVKETAKRYLIRILVDNTMVPGGRRLQTGEEVYVPKGDIQGAPTKDEKKALKRVAREYTLTPPPLTPEERAKAYAEIAELF